MKLKLNWIDFEEVFLIFDGLLISESHLPDDESYHEFPCLMSVGVVVDRFRGIVFEDPLEQGPHLGFYLKPHLAMMSS